MDGGDESDDSSSLTSSPYVDPLDDFRDEWQQEIENKTNRSHNARPPKQLKSPEAVDDAEEKVKSPRLMFYPDRVHDFDCV